MTESSGESKPHISLDFSGGDGNDGNGGNDGGYGWGHGGDEYGESRHWLGPE